MPKHFERGFTIIELIVVIAIISLLASIVLTNVNGYMAKARDAKRMSDIDQISKALYMYYAQNSNMPANPTPGTEGCSNYNYAAYQTVMQLLISGGFLSQIPTPPSGGWSQGYCYYNYGQGGAAGALVVTYLEAAPNSSTGLGSSCRPFTNNWCDQSSNKYYCMCNPF
jgi:type II secretion system protein G